MPEVAVFRSGESISQDRELHCVVLNLNQYLQVKVMVLEWLLKLKKKLLGVEILTYIEMVLKL